MQEQKQHGGARPGSGRPAGSRNRRSQALSEGLIEGGKCPALAPVRLAEQAEAEGRITVAIDARKAVLACVHARPRSIELEPEALVALARDLAVARASAAKESIGEGGPGTSAGCRVSGNRWRPRATETGSWPRLE
jgi:hypothetical protein